MTEIICGDTTYKIERFIGYIGGKAKTFYRVLLDGKNLFETTSEKSAESFVKDYHAGHYRP